MIEAERKAGTEGFLHLMPVVAVLSHAAALFEGRQFGGGPMFVGRANEQHVRVAAPEALEARIDVRR